MSDEKVYHKLVRDKIPQIIKESNKEPLFHIATEEEVRPLLFQKVLEELEEFKETPNEEELADLLEVIEGMAAAFNLDMNRVLAVKAKKKEERGGFEERIVLESVKEKV